VARQLNVIGIRAKDTDQDEVLRMKPMAGQQP
jgi:hypothetical protein